MRNGHVFRQVLWEPATNATAGGLLPTPTAGEAKQSSKVENWKRRQLKHAASGQDLQMPLTVAAQMKSAAMLPTPVAQTSQGGPKGLDGGAAARQMLADAGFPRAAGAPTPFLPTPTAALGASGGSNCSGVRRPENLASAVKTTLAVPQVYQGQARKRFLPTPTVNDSKNSSLPPSQADRDGLAGAMLSDTSIPTGEATYLNPSFVEEMMGFPVNWTKLDG